MSSKIPYYNVDVDESEDLVRAGPCEVTWGSVFNTHTAVQFLKFYDAAAVTDVTVGTTAPVMTLAVPPASAVPIAEIIFDLGCVVAATLLAADADTTAPADAVILSLSTV